MTSLAEWTMVAVVVVIFALIALGSWTLHSYLRNWPSRLLLASIVAFPLWIPILLAIKHLMYGYYAGSNDIAALNVYSNLIQINVVALSFFALSAATSFWFSVRSLGERPNNSFKPKPLRGSA